MANGIDWFRWHHGSVNDPKFGLVARKARARVGDVITVWALILEQASASSERGIYGGLDCEATDFLLDADDGTTARILEAMQGRGLVDGDRVTRWEERQPKRERVDNTAAERKREQREREKRERDSTNIGSDAGVPPSHTMSHQVTPREEESREEKNNDDDSAGATAAAAAVVVVVRPDELDNPRAAPMPPREDPPESPDPAIALSVALRKLGVNATFTHPTVLDWAARKVPMTVLHAAVATAREQKGPEARIPPNYLARIVEELLNPPQAAPGYGKPAAVPIQVRKPQGMDPKGTDESYDEYDARIRAAEASRRAGGNP